MPPPLDAPQALVAHRLGVVDRPARNEPANEATKAAAGQDPAGDLHEVATILVKNDWPLRQHATYGESIHLIMDVFEKVKREQARPRSTP